MPHLTCSTCRLVSYSAAGHATVDRCPRCDSPLGSTPRAMKALRGWNLNGGLATSQPQVNQGAPTVSRGMQAAGR